MRHPQLPPLYICLFLLCTVLPIELRSQTQFQYELEALAQKYAITSTDINCIFQDSKGFIWIGTKAGLSRFDGQEFEDFIFIQGESVARINDIVEDSSGNIWAGGQNGLYRFQQGSLHKFKSIDHSITSLHVDKEDNLLIGGVLFIPFSLSPIQRDLMYEGDLNRGSALVSPEDWSKLGPRTRVWDITTNANDQVWMGLDHHLINLKSQKLQIVWQDLAQKMMIKDIIAFDTDSVYFGSERSPFYFGSGGDFSPITQSISYISHVTDSAIFLLTSTELLKVQTNKVDTLFDFSHLPSIYFKGLILDMEGNFWVGTEGNLFKLTPRTFVNFTEEDNALLSANFSITESNDGTIVIGSRKQTILQIDGNDVSIFDRINAPTNSVTEAVFQDKKGVFWYGTSMGGIVHHHRGESQTFTVKDGLFDTEILFFREMSDGSFWCGGYNGVCRIIDSAGTYHFYSHSFPELVPKCQNFLI